MATSADLWSSKEDATVEIYPDLSPPTRSTSAGGATGQAEARGQGEPGWYSPEGGSAFGLRAVRKVDSGPGGQMEKP